MAGLLLVLLARLKLHLLAADLGKEICAARDGNVGVVDGAGALTVPTPGTYVIRIPTYSGEYMSVLGSV